MNDVIEVIMTTDTNQLKVHKKRQGSQLFVRLSGHLNEFSKLEVEVEPGIDAYCFDLEELDQINSVGVQVWAKMMTSIPSGKQMEVQRCGLRFVNNMNLYANFMGFHSVTVGSFYAPYYCEACDDSRRILLTPEEVRATGSLVPPKKNCSGCNKLLSFDGVPAKYFMFMKA